MQGTSALLRTPKDLAIGPDGSVYIADTGDYRVRRVAPNGIITTVAGNGTDSATVSDGGPATSTSIGSPNAISVGPDGNLYIGALRRVRRVAPNGIITTIAGSGAAGGASGDGGPGQQARFNIVNRQGGAPARTI